jgi:hypothetical protein
MSAHSASTSPPMDPIPPRAFSLVTRPIPGTAHHAACDAPSTRSADPPNASSSRLARTDPSPGRSTSCSSARARAVVTSPAVDIA